MATPIIEAIRARRDLKQSVCSTLIELAHRASIYGVVRVSQSYLAPKCHCSVRTVINHLAKGEERRIIRRKKTRLKGSYKWEINVYTFLIPWKKTPAQVCNGENSSHKLPKTEREKEKFGSVEEAIAKQEKALRIICTPGSDAYQRACEEIARLKACLRGGNDATTSAQTMSVGRG
jgi:hypothetical protein